MKITDNNITEYVKIENGQQQNTVQSQIKEQENPSFGAELPSVHTIGQSLINTNAPVSYTKLGEITIPGLKDKASVYKLANGQKVIIAPKKGPAMIKTTYNVGSMNETEDIRGMSHYIEHNLFNGSKDLAPREYDKQAYDLGARTNASTSYSTTNYFLHLQLLNDDSLEKAIKLNALQTQFPTFPIEQLEKEKEPVKSEIDMYKDMPDDVSMSIALKNLFNINTQSTNSILGTKDNINSFTREKVLDYFNTWYTPDNAVTVITGDVDTEETIKLVSKYFNKQNNYSNINKRHYEPISYTNKAVREDIILPNANNADIVMSFAVPENTSFADTVKLDVLLGVLSSSSSELSKTLDKDGLYLTFFQEKIQNKPKGAQAVIGSVSCSESQVEPTIKTIYEKLSELYNNPPSQKMLDDVKKRYINSINSTSEISESLNGQLTSMALENNFDYFNDVTNIVNSITPEDISQIAKKFLDLNKVSMCISHEKNANIETINNNYQNAFTNQNASIGKVSFTGSAKPKQNILDVENSVVQYRLPNNIETMTVEGTPGAKSSFSMNYSTDELNQIPQPALNILTNMLNRGSLYKNNDTYNELKNSLDIGINICANSNGLNILSDFTEENMSQALSMILETLNNPNFTESEFQRAKDIERDLIKSENVSAYDKLDKELYPQLRKYDLKEERLQQLEALTLNDIRNLYAQILATSKAYSTLTSAFSENSALKDTYNNMLSTLQPVQPFSLEKSPDYYIYQQNTQPKTLVTEDERAQAEIIQAYNYKYSENIDDIAKIKILNVILGGSMSSRLFSDLREDKKLAYSVQSGTNTVKDTGNISLYIKTTTESPDPKEGSPENINKALEGFNRNIELLKTQNVSDKELENAKTTLKTAMLNCMETNADKTDMFCNNKESPYGINFLSSLYEAIDKLTPDDIRNAANYVFANPPVTSIVASKKTLETLNLKQN